MELCFKYRVVLLLIVYCSSIHKLEITSISLFSKELFTLGKFRTNESMQQRYSKMFLLFITFYHWKNTCQIFVQMFKIYLNLCKNSAHTHKRQ